MRRVTQMENGRLFDPLPNAHRFAADVRKCTRHRSHKRDAARVL